jgi:hypothetical protein
MELCSPFEDPWMWNLAESTQQHGYQQSSGEYVTYCLLICNTQNRILHMAVDLSKRQRLEQTPMVKNKIPSWDQQDIPKRRRILTSLRRTTAQKHLILICIAVKARNLIKYSLCPLDSIHTPQVFSDNKTKDGETFSFYIARAAPSLL